MSQLPLMMTKNTQNVNNNNISITFESLIKEGDPSHSK